MIKIWSFGDTDTESEESLIAESKNLIGRQDSINNTILGLLDKEKLSNNTLRNPFQQHVSMSFGKTILNGLKTVTDIASTGSDYGLRTVTMVLDKDSGVFSFIGGTPSIVYKVNFTPERIEYKTDKFGFKIVVDLDEVIELLKFISHAYNVTRVDIGGLTPVGEYLPRIFFMVHSEEVSNSALSEENEKDRSALALFKIESSNSIAESQLLSFIEGINNYPEDTVIYSSSLNKKNKSTFKNKKYVELCQIRGILVVKTLSESGNNTAKEFVGTKVESSSGILPDSEVSFASIEGSHVLDILNYKTPENKDDSEPIKLEVPFYKKGDADLIVSDCVKVYSSNIEAYIGQQLRMNLPDSGVFLVKSHGEMVEATEKESLENSLKNVGLKKAERAAVVESLFTQEDKDEFDKELDNMVAMSNAAAQGEPVEFDPMGELLKLGKEINLLRENIDVMTSNLRDLVSVVNIMKSLMFDRVITKMGSTEALKTVPVLTEKHGMVELPPSPIVKPPSDVLDKKLSNSERVHNYLKQCPNGIVRVKVMAQLITEMKSSSITARLRDLVKMNIIAKKPDEIGTYYVPGDYEFRVLNKIVRKQDNPEIIIPENIK